MVLYFIGVFCSIAFLSLVNKTFFSAMWLRVVSFIFCILSSAYSFSQSSTPGGSVRITVLAGGNIDFVFNSISDYKTGITKLNYTVLGIEADNI